MSEPTLFTKIINREIPSEIVFENERIIVIKDIKPAAPVHLLGITKQPFQSLDALIQAGEKHKDLLWELMTVLSNLAHELGLTKEGKGYKLVANCGPEAGQTVFHLHVHLVGGRQLGEQITL